MATLAIADELLELKEKLQPADIRSAEQRPSINNESFLGSYICPCGSACSRRIATALYRVREVESLRSVSAAALNRGNRMVARLKGLSCLSAHHSNQQLTGRFTARSAAN
jgi:hypothetical protein